MSGGGAAGGRPAVLVFQGEACRAMDPWLEEITGLSPAQLRSGWDRAVHPEDLARLREALADCLEGRRGTETLSLRLENRGSARGQ